MSLQIRLSRLKMTLILELVIPSYISSINIKTFQKHNLVNAHHSELKHDQRTNRKVKYLDKRYKKKRSSYRLSRANGVSHGVLDDLGKTMWHTGSRTTFQMFRLCLMLLILIDRILPVSEQSNPFEPEIHPCRSTHSLLLLCSSHLGV